MVLTRKGYTKHYYAGTERVAARIGGGGLNSLCDVAVYNRKMAATASELFNQSLDQVNNRALQENDLECIMYNDFATEEFKQEIDGIPYRMQANIEIYNDEFEGMINAMIDDPNDGREEEVYFYHSDHLGSASWITDYAGDAVQHLQYLPFGERYIDQRMSGYNERFTFTGKEKDEETGFGYFGARYIDHELMTMWLSVDPLADKYPGISPYAYCAWNPVKLVDPDGRDFDPTMEKYASQVELCCDKIIKNLSERESLTDEQKGRLSELRSTKEEIQKMREDNSTYYCAQSASFDEKEKNTKGITQYLGVRDITRKGKKQYRIMVSLNTDKNHFKEEGKLNMLGIQTVAHELKHCYQFYNKESLYIQPADGGDFKMYNTQDLEMAAFRRGSAFGSFDRYNPSHYPNLSTGTMDDFIKENPGCKVVKHK